MLCSDFIERYSEYRDGVICDPGLEREIRNHLAGCRKCMDYDAYVSRGVMLLRATSDIAPSIRFTRRLEQRLREEGRSARRSAEARGIGTGVMATLAAAAAITLVIGLASNKWQRPSEPNSPNSAMGPSFNAVAPMMQGGATPVRPRMAPLAPHQAAGPPFIVTTSGAAGVDLNDQSVPAFSRDIAAPQPQVSFTTWVSVSR